MIVHIPEANSQLMERFVMFTIKGIISKFTAHVLVKKYVKLKRANLINPPNRAIMNVLLKLLIFRILHILTKSRIKTLIAQWVYPRMGFLFHTKSIPDLNVTLFLWQFWKSLILTPDLCPVNIELSAYKNYKIPVIGKCSLTLKHKKNHFDIFIVVDSKSVPILVLATSKNINLIKRISAVKVSDEKFLSEFSACLEKWELSIILTILKMSIM